MLQEYPPLSPQHTHNWCAGTGLHWLLREDCEIFRTYVGSLISVVRGVWKPANIINQHFSFPEKPVLNINQHTYVHTHIHTYTHRVKFVWFGVKKKNQWLISNCLFLCKIMNQIFLKDKGWTKDECLTENL